MIKLVDNFRQKLATEKKDYQQLLLTDPAFQGKNLRTKNNVDVTHKTILYLDGVNVSFDGFKALNDLSLYIDDGELRCIIGPNGAGKT
ncbi:MAG: ABC transporter ATP-binding protein, partial [Pseudomonadota bacterium]